MNDYEGKKQARIDRYRERAARARGESSALHNQAFDMLDAIPPGQPIIGKSDRRYRERIDQKMGKAIEASEKADYYEQKAQAAENNTAISSDDPDALDKLQKKLESLKSKQAFMKKVNAYYRKHKTCEGCEGVSPELAAKLDESMKTAYSWETAPFPPYALTNNNANIRRIEGRIKQLTKAQETGYRGWEFEGGKVIPNMDLNRLQIFFDEIPPAEVRSALKGWGFRWARSVGAWQRQLTNNAIYAASHIPAIRPKDGSDPVKLQPKQQKKQNKPER